jgi:hypothetical protein
VAAIPEVVEVLEVLEVREVIEDLTAVPPIIGVAPVEYVAPVAPVAAIPEVVEVSHLEVGGTYTENNPEAVAKDLAATADGNGSGNDYYHLTFNGAPLNAALQPVSLKVGPRAAAPGREIVEITAGGSDVGSTVRDI